MKTTLTLTVLFLAMPLLNFAQAFTSSNLPIVVINTGSNVIVDDPKVEVDMGIIYNGPGQINNLTDPMNHYNGKCGIELRGNSSQGYQKKAYSIELWTAAGADTSVNLLGMGKEEDWVLHSTHIDKSFMRNDMTFKLWREMGHWASEDRFCEVVIDGDYRGLYLLMEKVKMDDDRLHLATLNDVDISGNELTGGYILQLDWLDDPEGFESDFNGMSNTDPLFFQYYYPKINKIQPQQEAYIKAYMDSCEYALFDASFSANGLRYNQLMDIPSFVDLTIINEISRSVDAYKLSSFVHKDKYSKGGKLKAGPIWDYDLAYYNADYCGGENTAGWTYLQAEADCDDLNYMPMWWDRFMNDPVFVNHLRCRWDELKTDILHVDSLNAYIDLMVDSIDDAQIRNFQRWSILGVNIFGQPEPVPTTYVGEITALKDWLVNRIAWIDANLSGNCAADIVGINEVAEKPFKMYPNPTRSIVRFEFNSTKETEVEILDLIGKSILKNQITTLQTSIDLSEFAPGTYLVRITKGDQFWVEKLIKH
jgi:hypothetical protein